MALWDTIVGWVSHPAVHHVYAPIPASNVAGDGAGGDAAVPGRDYFRLWVSEMYLRKDVNWFKTWHPAVHSLVRYTYGTRQVDIPQIAGELDLNGVDESHLERVVQLNYQLTTLIPFSGGAVKIAAGLLAMEGQDYLKRFIKVLSDFSGLLAQPQLSAALNLVGPVATGIEELLGATNGQLHLGMHQTFASAGGGGDNVLRPGYIAVVRAGENEVAPERLWVQGDRLRVGRSLEDNTPFTGYPYMLFRIEVRSERDDWEGLAAIVDPFNEAVEALGAGENERAETFFRKALATAAVSPDLTAADRRRVTEALKERFDEIKGAGLGAVDVDTTFGDVVRRTMSVDDALAAGEPDLEELTASRT
jgi:hypothetical protein